MKEYFLIIDCPEHYYWYAPLVGEVILANITDATKSGKFELTVRYEDLTAKQKTKINREFIIGFVNIDCFLAVNNQLTLSEIVERLEQKVILY